MNQLVVYAPSVVNLHEKLHRTYIAGN